MVGQLIAEVRADDTLPIHVADLMLRRLHDMSWALDHVELMGAEGIASAAERMAVAYFWAKREADTAVDESKDASTDESKDPSPDDSTATLLGKFWDISKKASEAISVPGAWYGTWQLMAAVAPNLIGR